MKKEEYISRVVLTAIVYKAINSISRFNDISDEEKLSIIHRSISNNIKELSNNND